MKLLRRMISNVNINAIISIFFFFIFLPCTFGNTTTPAIRSRNAVKTKSDSELPKNYSTDNSFDYEDDYNDEDDDDDNYEGTGSRNTGSGRASNKHRHAVYIIKRVGVTYAWGKWEKWSRCNNSCVQIRKRHCIKRTLTGISAEPIDMKFFPNSISQQQIKGCIGIWKKYRLCKDEKCKSSNDQMRAEQCAAFNPQPFKANTWLSHQKEHNECELYCKNINSDVFISMNQTVIDGTPCKRPSIYYTHGYHQKAVCVEGLCKAVHSSGAIRPATTSDSQEKCGSVLCEKVTELYDQANVINGYNMITTIPAGAMNMTIKQMAKSNNLLALKSPEENFIINGNNRASESGIFEFNGDSFDYNKESSLIVSKGPLNSPVVLLLLAYGSNPGISYSYNMPVASASVSENEEQQSQWNELGQPLDDLDDNLIEGTAATQVARAKERKRKKFAWKLLGFGQCNRSCGPGVQPPIFRCIRESPTRYYSPKRCAYIEKPQFSDNIYQCNRGLCPAYWRPGKFGDCECIESTVNGVRARNVECVQEQANGVIEQVDESKCGSDKLPVLNETCDCPKMLRRKLYSRSQDKSPKMYSRLISAPGPVKDKRQINSTHSSNPLKRFSRDDSQEKAGVWLMSDWNNQCSNDCSQKSEYRTIYCDRTAPFTDMCDIRFMPDHSRTCSRRTHSCRRGVWFTSPWSNCTGECHDLHRSRMVLCLKDGFVVDDKQCSEETRPKDRSNCTQKQVEYCGPKWHYSDWSECSRSCGDGVQRRYAKCLEFDWKLDAMLESSKCKYTEREPVYGACGVVKCEELKAVSSLRKAATTAVAVATTAPPTPRVIQGIGVAGKEEGGGTDVLVIAGKTERIFNNGVEIIYGSKKDSALGKEKIVIAGAPKYLENCNDELTNCKRINRERLCKLDYYKNYCCLTCHGYY